ncbi:hypothetical protein [Anianabacter salinae]|uniref:hypothetical protein n=1 Tax=Anianabacter salinae TaxID=2851023 RepID=UPI00225DDDD8|nr:hypothetical protein [Anianabacter salinae]MBV0911346.1 hypothetical protein [Anianabacter salinae]
MTILLRRVFLAAALSAVTALPVAAQNRSIDQADTPAELPPSSFDGRQYVDSRGCVYIRAGFDGNVTWVPRVTRGRQVVCGFQPTFPNGTTTAQAPRQTAPAQQPRVVQAPPPAAQPRGVAPSSGQNYVSLPPPQPTGPAPQQPTYAPAPRQTGGGSGACPNVAGISGQYLQRNGRYAVRCGPQAEDPYSGRAGAQLRVPDASAVQVPNGYKAAWTDDRLNPNRGVQTLTGNAQMTLVWTQEVPRRLVERGTGRDFTALYANMRPTGAQKVPGQRVTIVTPNGNRSYVIVANRADAAPGSNVRYSTKNIGQ